MSDLTLAQAQESVERAKTHLEAAAEEVVRQINGRAWLALGYSSWDEMREAEYRGAAVIVPRADRPELVAKLRAEGLSQKQIGDTIGVAKSTVQGDLDKADSDFTDQPATRVDTLGRERPTTYAPRSPQRPVETFPPAASFQEPSAADPQLSEMAEERERQRELERESSQWHGWLHVYVIERLAALTPEEITKRGAKYNPKAHLLSPLTDEQWDAAIDGLIALRKELA